MTPPTATSLTARFPLVARKRPAAKPIAARTARLAALADDAVRDHDFEKAAIVFNGAALLASDCGDSELARTWCLRHARLYLDRPSLNGYTGRFALEPVVNLARLRIRSGDHDGAYDLVNRLYHAVQARVPTAIDGLEICPDHLPSEPDQHDQIMGWLNDVMLSDGTRALTTAGRWSDALAHIRLYDGIGPTLREGRQVAVITLTMQGNNATAAALLRETTIEQPWEQVVRDLLRTWHAQVTGIDRPADHCGLLDQASQIPLAPGLSVFRTRLCLAVIDVIPGMPPASMENTISRLAADILRDEDANAARDLLAHPAVGQENRAPLMHLVEESGLATRRTPEATRDQLSSALDRAEAVIGHRVN